MKDKPKQDESEKTRSFLSALSPKERAQLREHFKLEESEETAPDTAQSGERDAS